VNDFYRPEIVFADRHNTYYLFPPFTVDVASFVSVERAFDISKSERVRFKLVHISGRPASFQSPSETELSFDSKIAFNSWPR
jgi:hypothetical protein